VEALEPRWCRVIADFGIRGGISISVDAEYKQI
jgi:7-cyano-7-deazaguanine reductase